MVTLEVDLISNAMISIQLVNKSMPPQFHSIYLVLVASDVLSSLGTRA